MCQAGVIVNLAHKSDGNLVALQVANGYSILALRVMEIILLAKFFIAASATCYIIIHTTTIIIIILI